MAINGADAIRSPSPEMRATSARFGNPRDSAKRAPKPSTPVPAPEPRVPPPVAERIQLPEFVGRDLSFRHDEELNRVIVEVVDAETREVVRTIPSEEVVKILKNIRKAQGALLDEEA